MTCTRRYQALSRRRAIASAAASTVGGNYTLSRAVGQCRRRDGQRRPSGASDQRIIPNTAGRSGTTPQGDLAIDQRHRARVLGDVSPADDPRRGRARRSGLVQQIGSGVPYGAVGARSTRPSFMANPGYATAAERRSNILHRAATRSAPKATYPNRLSVNYSTGFAGSAQPELFFHGEVLNVFNEFQLCGCGDTVIQQRRRHRHDDDRAGRASADAPRIAFNPYTTTPVEGAIGTHAANFGTAAEHISPSRPRGCSAFRSASVSSVKFG